MPDLSPSEATVLRHLASVLSLRASLRYIDDVAAAVSIPLVDAQDALRALVGKGMALVGKGMVVCQEVVDEEPDGLTGRRGQLYRPTLAGHRALDEAPGLP